MMNEGGKEFAVKDVPLYGWAALAIVGWALYNRNWMVAVIAVAAWVFAKWNMGRFEKR